MSHTRTGLANALAPLLALALGACFERVVPSDAQISCSPGGAPCPDGFTCQASIGRCVPLEGESGPGIGEGPKIVADSVDITPPAVRRGEIVRLNFEVDRELFERPEVRLESGNRLAFLEQSGQGYVYTYEVRGNEAESRTSIVADLVDTAGNTSSNVVIGPVTFDFTVPQVADLVLEGPAMAGPGALLAATFSVVESLASPPVLHLGGRDMQQDPSHPSEQGYRFTYSVVGDELSGWVGLNGSMVDAVGNEGHIERQQAFQLDLDPPTRSGTPFFERCDNAVDARLLPNDIWVKQTLGCAFELDQSCENPPQPFTAPVKIGFALSEVIDTTALRIWAEDGADLVVDSCASTGSWIVALYTPGGDEPQTLDADAPGTPVKATVQDLAGNQAELDLGVLRFDFDAPPEPAVSVADAVVYTRVPWGVATFAASQRTPRFAIRGAEASVEPNARLVAYSNPNVELAAVIGETYARDDGSFGDALDGPDRFQLDGVDRQMVYLSAVDAAGNASTPALVRDGEWFVSMNGKIAGTDRPNPNVLWAHERAEPARRIGDQREPPTSVLAALQASDSQFAGELSSLQVRAARQWRQRSVGTPETAALGRATFITSTGQLLTYGGMTDEVTHSVLWTWDGTDWTSLQPVGNRPQARVASPLVYDSARDRVVVHGGVIGSGSSLNDTWEWDGQGWLELTPLSNNPEPRALAAMAYDSERGVAVLFGGSSRPVDGLCTDGSAPYLNFCFPDDTWEWDGVSWTEACAGCTPRPSGRNAHGLTYDPDTGKVVLFGGCRGFLLDNPGCRPDELLADTWEWDGQDWVERTPPEPSASPAKRFSPSMVYDTVDRQPLLFAGCSSGSLGVCEQLYNDLWHWDSIAGQWLEEPSGSAPEPRAFSAAVFDSARGELIVLGGINNSEDYYRDQWSWRREAGGQGQWTKTGQPGEPPPHRDSPALAFSAATSRVVLYGGDSMSFVDACDSAGTIECGDLWEWDGHRWNMPCAHGEEDCGYVPITAPYVDVVPSARNSHTLVEVGDLIYSLGGYCRWSSNQSLYYCDDVWSWNSADERWVAVSDNYGISGVPTPFAGRIGTAASWDANRNQVVLFGGAIPWPPGGSCPAQGVMNSAGDACLLCDTWIFDVDAQTWTPGPQDACDSGSVPPPRSDHGMVYNVVTDQMTLFGGCSAYEDGRCLSAFRDQWSWNGSAWSQVDVSGLDDESLPQPTNAHRMVYDSYRGRIILDGGGEGDGGRTTSMWEWDGSRWHRIQTSSTIPNPRRHHGLAYDASRQLLTLVGSDSFVQGETWTLDLSPGLRPAAVFEIAWDAANATGVGPHLSDMSTFSLRAAVAGIGRDNDDPQAPLDDSNAVGQAILGTRIEAWRRDLARWVEIGGNCDSTTAMQAGEQAPLQSLPAEVTVSAEVQSYVVGAQPRIYVRLQPCRGSGNSAELAELWIDYLEASVTYRLSP